MSWRLELNEMLRNSILALSAGTLFFSQALAENGPVPTEAVEQAKRFASSLGCYFGNQDVLWDDVPPPAVTLQAEQGLNDNAPYREGLYLVFAYTDVGCQGGSGGGAVLPVTVEKNMSSSAFYVIPELSGPEIQIDGVNLWSLESVRALDARHIEVVWSEYAEGDANCCPSINNKTMLEKDENGNWAPW
jgi:hypothetical protein